MEQNHFLCRNAKGIIPVCHPLFSASIATPTFDPSSSPVWTHGQVSGAATWAPPPPIASVQFDEDM